jgi:hypothetical protein
MARAEIAGGAILSLGRGASCSRVSPCESALTDHGQDETGRVPRLLLTARNTRRAKTLAADVSTTPPEGFTPSVTDQTVEAKPGAELKLRLTLTAASNQPSGWCETTVRVAWEGASRSASRRMAGSSPSG